MRNNIFRFVLPLLLLTILALPIRIRHTQSQSTLAVPQTTTVEYASTSAVFPNPERGFYHDTETHSDHYTPLEEATLQGYRQNENSTLILRVFYLEQFIASDISPTYLAAMQADFDTVRQAGLKIIVRFAYTDQLPAQPPYGDAPKARILRHLEQLQPLLQANSDVIAVVQAGFIGVFGEWFYTDYFVADPANPDLVTAADWANRRDVLTALLNVLPVTRMTQVRTPFIKQQIFGSTLPIGSAEAYSGSTVARTGHHNDCFLASDTDFGTYSSEHSTEEKDYLAAETQAVPMGGETCALNPPRSACATATAELARFHWSFLNKDYHPDVIHSWDPLCFDDIQRQLGYRFTLLEGRYANDVQPGGTFTVSITLQNAGWAAAFNPRLVELVLRQPSNGALYHVKLPDDPRLWLPERGSITLTHTICTSADLPPGQYELLLNLPDPELSKLPAYSIHLANTLVWEASTGYNKLLHTITVMEPAKNTGVTSAAMVAVCQKNTYLPIMRTR